MSSLPAPRIDEDNYDIIEHDVADLAERRGLWIGDEAHADPPRQPHRPSHPMAGPTLSTPPARTGASRHDIAVLIGASDEQARLRFAADSHPSPTGG